MVCALFALLSLLAGGATAVSTSAATLYVDRANPSCSNYGPGSPDAAVLHDRRLCRKATPGTTVQVAAGTYAEQVSPKTGASGSPIVFTAAPGATVTVTGKSYGFYLSGLSWVTVNGFTRHRHDQPGHLRDRQLERDHLRQPRHLVGPAGQRTDEVGDLSHRHDELAGLREHDRPQQRCRHPAVERIDGRRGARQHVTFSNAQVWQRQAAGIRLYKSPGNTVDGNITHDNEDSGIESFTGSNNTLIYDNVSYRNGDHGIDDYGWTGQRIISNSVYKNVTAGINVEGRLPARRSRTTSASTTGSTARARIATSGSSTARRRAPPSTTTSSTSRLRTRC